MYEYDVINDEKSYIKIMYIMQMKSLKENNYYKATSHLFCSTFHFMHCCLFIVWVFFHCTKKNYMKTRIFHIHNKKYIYGPHQVVKERKIAWMSKTIVNKKNPLLWKSILKFILSISLNTSDTIFSSYILAWQ